MRALVCAELGPPEKLAIEERDALDARPGSVVVGVRDLRLVLGVVTLKVISHQGSKLVDPGRRVLHKPILPAARDGLRASGRPVA